MIPLTDTQIRASLVNGSQGDAKRAALPDLDGVAWDDLDYLGWHDPKRPRLHYVVLEVDGEPAGLILRGAENPPAKKLLCAWCEDVVDGVRAASFVAPLAGDAGRRGNSVGTVICGDFRCSRNVRRAPTSFELRTEDPELLAYHRQQRIEGLRERSAAFVRTVRRG